MALDSANTLNPVPRLLKLTLALFYACSTLTKSSSKDLQIFQFDLLIALTWVCLSSRSICSWWFVFCCSVTLGTLGGFVLCPIRLVDCLLDSINARCLASAWSLSQKVSISVSAHERVNHVASLSNYHQIERHLVWGICFMSVYFQNLWGSEHDKVQNKGTSSVMLFPRFKNNNGNAAKAHCFRK